MKTLKTILPIALLLFAVITIGPSCGGDLSENPKPTPDNCTEKGLYYTVDDGQEVYVAQTINVPNVVFSHNTSNNTGLFLMANQSIGNNPFIFQSSATDINQASLQTLDDLAIVEGSNLEIFSLWSSNTDLEPDVVNINFKCTKFENELNGKVQYTFNGNYTSETVTHHIEGRLCLTIDEIRGSL